ncbi:Uncharacterized protein TCAP_06277, partial [Tolypocladium capitatum]
MSAPSGLDSELESFRQQWLSDLRTRRGDSPQAPRPEAAAPPSPARRRRAVPSQLDDDDDDDDHLQGRAFDHAEPPQQSGNTLDGSVRPRPARELVSALDHYEEAMEKEAQGNMGDSLKLYRQAYRLDNRVDRRYREKHFPPGGAAPPKPPSTPASSRPAIITTTTTTSQPHLQEPSATDPQALSTADLIASFSALSIPPAPPHVEHT